METIEFRFWRFSLPEGFNFGDYEPDFWIQTIIIFPVMFRKGGER